MSEKNKKKKKTSLADIAKSLGVSRTLVSMVLNNRGDENGINPETQKRVIAKAKELNYKPNLLARGLRLGRTNTIGLIVTDISNIFYSRIARSMEDLASKDGYRLMMCSSDEDPEKEAELIQMFKERQADGLIIASSFIDSKELDALKEDNFPFVLIDRHLGDPETHTVTVDNREGAKKAISYFVSLGWDKIAFLAISPNHISTIKERLQGYQEGLLAHNLEFDPGLIREIPFNRIRESIYEEMDSLLAGKDPIRAIFVSNNNLAIACMEYAKDRGLRIPEDFSLVSFDDTELFKICAPPITAISQPMGDIGKRAIEILLKAINDKEGEFSKQRVVLSTQLEIRESCSAKDPSSITV